MNVPVELLCVDLSTYTISSGYKSIAEAEAESELINLLRSDTYIGSATRKKLKVKEYKKVIIIEYGDTLDQVNHWYLMTEHAIRMTFLAHSSTEYCNNIIGICK